MMEYTEHELRRRKWQLIKEVQSAEKNNYSNSYIDSVKKEIQQIDNILHLQSELQNSLVTAKILTILFPENSDINNGDENDDDPDDNLTIYI